MPTAHDETRRDQVFALHRRCGRVCSACGQSWPCTEIDWAAGYRQARELRIKRLVRGLVLTICVAAVLVPVEVWLLVRLAHVLGVWR